MKKEKIILIGGGGHCRSAIDIIERENKYEIAGIIDKKEMIGSNIFDYEIIGCDDDLKVIFKDIKNALITVGHLYDNKVRVNLYKKLKNIGFSLPTIISPFSYVSKYSFIEEGTIIMHHALVNANVKIGKNCIINSKALVEHDVIIEDHCHISTGTILNGGVFVKANTFIGSNSTSKQYSEIHGFIKAGSLVK
ncbi:NeuD/PglB/VioB family sugar acetyltransferase [Arcobacter sp.]|uniref:NeuD/PglB/VioB family sugar acetyltransferase n=1 Tax=Arcobacter sp. TaxID=1872629 RepID=UPI003D120EFD